MDLHEKTHELKDLLFVKQFRHETRISLILHEQGQQFQNSYSLVDAQNFVIIRAIRVEPRVIRVFTPLAQQ